MSEEKVEELANNIVLGLERTLSELGNKLPDEVDGMTTKQLRRALKATINYIHTKEDATETSALHPRELRFLGGLFTLIETGNQYSIHILGECQREYDEKQALNKQGEGNE